MMRKARIVWKHIGKYMYGKKMLDVGMGSGSFSYFLNKKGFDVQSVDVASLSIYDDLKPVIYDGKTLPFKDREFDTAVIIHVLHHCSDGLRVLEEAKRCSKRVIFIEDTYRNQLEWFVVASFDSITNFEFWWHKYRTIHEWKKIIKDKGWKVVSSDQWSEGGITSPFGRYCMFVIE
jgi:ubiquinone/menaquinone biosynthesis C-methylase UbiE